MYLHNRRNSQANQHDSHAHNKKKKKKQGEKKSQQKIDEEQQVAITCYLSISHCLFRTAKIIKVMEIKLVMFKREGNIIK